MRGRLKARQSVDPECQVMSPPGKRRLFKTDRTEISELVVQASQRVSCGRPIARVARDLSTRAAVPGSPGAVRQYLDRPDLSEP